MPLKISCPEVLGSDWIPVRYTAQGASINPPLRWSGAPSETRELALICEDPDAPMAQPFVHWLLYGISPNTSAVPKGLPSQEALLAPIVARQGKNSLEQIGYTGPNPPLWHGPHRYVFKLYALKQELGLESGARREEFLKALKGKILSQATWTGVYGKSRQERVRSVVPWIAGSIALVYAAYSAARKTAKGVA